MYSIPYYSALVAAALLPLTLAQPSVVVEDTPQVPFGWHLKSKANGNESLSLSIALAQPGLDDLEAFMLGQPTRSQSTAPASFLSQSQLLAYQTPPDSAVHAVMDWLADNQIHDAQIDGPWIRLNTTVASARRLFEADVALYSHGNASPVLRAPRYTVPASLADYIDFVFPLAHFMPPRPTPLSTDQAQIRGFKYSANSFTNETCDSGLSSPTCIRKLYNWPLNISSHQTPSPVRLGIAGFLGQYIRYNDVKAFLRLFAPEIASSAPEYSFNVELINGGKNPQSGLSLAGTEASLDVQYAMALAFPAQITYYSTGGIARKVGPKGQLLPPEATDNEPYMSLLTYLVGLPDHLVPHVLSVSYSDDEQSVPRPYATWVCRLFLQLASRGTTVLVASGDGGSRGIGQEFCLRNDGSGERTLLPTFPASCPWVTAVGSTNNNPPTQASGFSAGGFSNYFPRPRWQNGMASKYISTVLQGSNSISDKEGLYNASGRAIPDIAAVGSDFPIVWEDFTIPISGTSASTPVVASMIAMVNDVRLRAGRPPLGWLNGKLYSHGLQTVYQDIVDGISFGCPFNRIESVSGWPAAPGWDAVTGLGVPHDLSLLMDALVNA
ncbi:tripeptidyl peptidase sed3 [Grosmannia clavigera kw1407]|uniref:tripeptidyl-peptidase II n=1 Tax=Grosmannia clavigera (strain kw1407 / UAMH 11150) TaxID=655863 RepID=F0XJ09_GROCL|nr:tripeptidyl peptidase sed3 [Grosmannia clavigera kw1407]EFX02098.1 tripeptidyl peptidase sed3 [Grosmannia clavigera kw1407]